MKKEDTSYNQIIKTTSIFGGSQVIVALIGLVRNKIIAVLLGPVGIGILGIYQSIIDMMRTVSMLGMDTAGVKDIAEAASTDDRSDLYKVIARFNKWFEGSALLALFLCVAFCYPISLWAFESGEYTVYIALLSVSVAALILSVGKSSILQGMRKITDMAKITVFATLIGLVVTIPIYYFWRLDGIIPALTLNSLVWLLSAEYYYRQQKIEKVKTTSKEAFRAGLGAFRLGLYIVVAGFVSTLSMFAVRAFVSRNIDVDAAGLFQASWVITNIYFGLLLKAMGSDFFPRLSAMAKEKDKLNNLVNEQSYVVLVLSSPVIVTMLLFAENVLSILYTPDFVYAGGILKWQLLGTFFKIISWPISFVLLARNKGLLFLMTEVVFYAVYLLSVYLLYPLYGLEVTGMGYLIAYAVYSPVIFFAVRRISGFSWNKHVLKIILVNLLLVAVSFVLTYYYTGNMLLNIAVLGVSALYTCFMLKKIFSIKDMKNWFSKK